MHIHAHAWLIGRRESDVGVHGMDDLQWMTAGRGVVHAEMPGGQGVQRGINLMINLSAKDKMYVYYLRRSPHTRVSVG